MRHHRLRGSAVAASVVLILLVASAVVGATSAGAHSEYTRSTPAAGARVPRAPARVEVWFSQELFRRAGANALEVRAPDGSVVDDGESIVDNADRTHLSVGLRGDLGPGAYVVRWRSLSAIDGDTAEGSFDFTIDPLAPEAQPVIGAAPAATSEVTSALGRSGDAPWWLAIAASAILGTATLIVLAVRAPFEETGS